MYAIRSYYEPSEIPMARPEDVRWANIKTAANRWYARLEADERRNASLPRPAPRARRPIPLTVAFEEPRRRDPLGDLQIDVELEAAAPERLPEEIPVAVGVGKRR